MKRHIITERSNPILGKGIAAALSQAPAEYTVEVFPDGEVYVCIETPLIVDDMISTAGTLVAAIKVVLEKGCATKIFGAATHGLFVNSALERLNFFPIEKIFVTDSLVCKASKTGPLETIGLAKLIAKRIEVLSDH